MKNTILWIMALLSIVMGFSSCSDDVDESNLYVFTGKSITDYIKEEPQLSYYYMLLQRTKSGKKGSTVDHLLEARGNYTVFAPTNDAVQHYLDSIYAVKDYDVTQTPDSVAQDIVFNSIIDSENNDAYRTTAFLEGTFDYKSMADRFVTVSFGSNDSTGRVAFYIDAFSKIISPDNEAENGWMHVVDRVVMPYSSTLPDLIASQDNLKIFSHLLLVTHLSDSLTLIRDEKYEEKDKPDRITTPTMNDIVPRHRYYGYTAFVEPDSLLCAKWGVTLREESGGVANWDEIMQRVEQVCKEYYPNATDPDLTSPDNAVNQFVTKYFLRCDGHIAGRGTQIEDYSPVGHASAYCARIGVNIADAYGDASLEAKFVGPLLSQVTSHGVAEVMLLGEMGSERGEMWIKLVQKFLGRIATPAHVVHVLQVTDTVARLDLVKTPLARQLGGNPVTTLYRSPRCISDTRMGAEDVEKLGPEILG